MSQGHRDNVRNGYDHMADAYLAWTRSRPSPRTRYLQLLLENLPKASRVLEIGCGPGVPVLQQLFQHVDQAGGSVIGNDVSAKQIDLARQHCPKAQLIQGDMNDLGFDSGSLDAVVSFYALFHLPREEHRPVLEKIFNWLRPGGWFVCTLAAQDRAEITQTFLGAKDMFWSSFAPDVYRKMLPEIGFAVEKAEVLSDENSAQGG